MNATSLLMLILTFILISTNQSILILNWNNFIDKTQELKYQQVTDGPPIRRKGLGFPVVHSNYCIPDCNEFNSQLFEKINETKTNSSSISKELKLKILESGSFMQEFLVNYQQSMNIKTCYNDKLCVYFGDCCPDKDRYLLDKTYDYYRCVTIPIKSNVTIDYLLISKCLPFVNHDNDTKTKCEDDFSLKYSPVTSNPVGRVYRNEFCAKCNGVFNFTKWKAKIVLDSENWYDRISHIRNFSDVKELMKFYIKTIFIIPKEMPKPWICSNSYGYIDYCNVTGRMSEFAPWEEAGCLSYTDPVSIFRNVFCTRCNLDIFCIQCPQKGFSNSNFGALMDITALQKYENYIRAENEKKLCKVDEFYDYTKGSCRHFYCSLGLFRTPNHNCSYIFTSVDYILYKIHFSLLPQPQNIITKENISNIFNEWNKTSEWKQSLVTLRYKLNNQSNEQSPRIVDKMLFYVQFGSEQSKEFVEIENIVKTWFLNIKNSSAFSSFHIVMDLESLEFSENYLLTRQYHKSLYKPHLYETFPTVQKAILYSDIRECPKVRLGHQEFILNEDNLVILNRGSPVSLTMDRVEINSNGTPMICLSDYPGASSSFELPTSDFVEMILSNVFLGISLFCLAMTLITYTVFSELRTLPGKCNIFLCSTLFTAQALLLFHVTENELACTIIGSVRHFAWLSTFAWMGVCSFHMCRIFTRLLTSNDLKPNKTIVKYALVAYGLPLLVVIGTVVTNMVIYGVRFTGYGLPNCYLTRSIQLILTFALPLSLMIIFNTSLLSITIYSLYKTYKACKLVNKDKKRVIVYLKLSTLTGITWIFGLLSMAFPDNWIKYIFIVTNASQGIYIFLSYTFNANILKLYTFKLSCLRPLSQHNINASSVYSTETTSAT